MRFFVEMDSNFTSRFFSIRVTYITGATTLVWFHNSLRKPSRFPEKRCFNLAPKTPNKFFHLFLILILDYPVLAKLLRNIYVIHRPGGPYWEKLCPRSRVRPEAAGLGPHSRQRAQFFPIRTDQGRSITFFIYF